MRIAPKYLLRVVLILGAAQSTSIHAALVEIYAIPTGWRIQNYTYNGSVALYYTGATCGQLNLPSAASEEQRNRLWSTIATAKLANKKVGIYYDNNSCNIDSFYMQD